MQIRLGGLTFSGDGGPTLFSVERDGLQGWIGKGGVGVRRDDVARPLSHGSFKRRGYRTGREVTWSGDIETSSAYEQDQAIAKLGAVLADGEFGRLTIESAFGVHWCDVQLNDEPEVHRDSYGRFATYRISVWSPDPEVFGETETFAPGAVFQHGTFRTVASAVVTGPLSAPYTLDVDGQQFTVTQSLASGQTHAIDTRRGRVRRNGVLQSGVIAKAQSLIVNPGPPVNFTGPSSARLKVTRAYM